MNDAWVLISIFAIVVIIFAIGLVGQKRDTKEYLKAFREKFGEKYSKSISADELLNISSFYKNMSSDSVNHVDDTTWNDLDMDAMFKRMDKTQSQPGAEVLYMMLRQMVDDEELERRNALINHFGDANSCCSYVKVLHAIGHDNKNSFSCALNGLDECEGLNATKHLLCMALGTLSFLMIFIKAEIGFVLFIFATIYNVTTYLKEKEVSKEALNAFSKVLRLLKYARLIEAIDDEKTLFVRSQISESLKDTNSVKYGAFLVMNQGSAAGGLFDLIIDYLRMYLHIDMLIFNRMLKITKAHKNELLNLWYLIGYIDACIAIADFRQSLPYYCEPVFENAEYKCEGLYHPLIDNAVDNSIDVKSPLLLTGSNASGKSTFLKTIALNALLSQTIFTSISKRYVGFHYKILTSMSLNDNIQTNESYYMVEIKSLKRILDSIDGEYKILCCIDEVLRGTNTAERIAASAAVLEYLAKENVLCVAATHDLELSVLLGDIYDNYHFTEIIDDNSIVFPYKIIEGPTTSRNAIKLLSLMGFDEEIVKRADSRCKTFLEKKVWM